MYVMIDQESDKAYIAKNLEPLLNEAKELLKGSGYELGFDEPKFLKEKYYLSDSCFSFYIVHEAII